MGFAPRLNTNTMSQAGHVDVERIRRRRDEARRIAANRRKPQSNDGYSIP
jgi:hypothetical protein